MKTILILAGVLLSATPIMAGPSSPATPFNPAITRQDFTGQGTYHRIGLVREQQRALAAQNQAQTVSHDPATATPNRNWLARLWQSLFPPRSTSPAP